MNHLSQSIKYGVVAAIFLLLALAPTPAMADTVTFSNIQALWFNANPASAIDSNTGLSANAQVRWGGAGAGDSGYNFTAAGTFNATVPPSPSANFIIGGFQHVNFPIAGASITGIDLQINANIAVNAVSQGTKSFFFHFTHDETTNDPPCPFGPPDLTGININGCADRVQVGFLDASETFLVGGQSYTVSLLGFDPGSGVVSDFLTAEDAINNANLIGNVTLKSALVPEPSSFVLLIVGMTGLGISRKRKLA